MSTNIHDISRWNDPDIRYIIYEPIELSSSLTIHPFYLQDKRFFLFFARFFARGKIFPTNPTPPEQKKSKNPPPEQTIRKMRFLNFFTRSLSSTATKKLSDEPHLSKKNRRTPHLSRPSGKCAFWTFLHDLSRPLVLPSLLSAAACRKKMTTIPYLSGERKSIRKTRDISSCWISETKRNRIAFDFPLLYIFIFQDNLLN